MADFQFLRRRVYTAAQIAKKGIPNPRYDTSDIAQESVLQLLKEVRHLGDDKTTYNESYLQKVGAGNAHELLRKNSAQKRATSSEEANTQLDHYSGLERDPLQLLQDQEAVVILIKTISQLDSIQQVVVYRRFFDRAVLKDIAAELNTSIDIVRRTCEKAINELRKQLTGQEEIE